MPARARPGCSPTASRTGRNWARWTRNGCWRSPSPARRPESCRDRLGRLGLRDGVHAGTFHAIALRPAAPALGGAGSAPAGAAGAQGRLRGPPHPRPHGPHHPAGRGGGDRVGVGPPHHPGAVRAGRHPGPATAPGLPGHRGHGVRAVHRAEAAPPAGGLRRPPPAGGAGPGRGPGVRRGPALAVPPPVRRRVPGRQPPPVRAAVGLAGPGLGRLHRGRPQPGHLRLERRRRPLPHRLRPLLPRRGDGGPGGQLPLHPPGAGRGQRRPPGRHQRAHPAPAPPARRGRAHRAGAGGRDGGGPGRGPCRPGLPPSRGAVVGPGRAGAHQRAGRPHGRGVHGGVGSPTGSAARPTSWNSPRSATRSPPSATPSHWRSP